MQRLTKLAKLAVTALEDLKGQDIRVLDVKKLTTVTDWMVICTGTSNRHVKSLADNVIEEAKKAGSRPQGAEGREMGEWVLVDLGAVVVHVMQAQTRAFYQLEKLWDVKAAGEGAPAKAAKVPKTAKTPKTPKAPKAAKKPRKPRARKGV